MFANVARPCSTAATIVAKSSSSSTRSAASRATSVPERPIAMPMSASCSAGPSFTPSPVIATTWPRCRKRAGDAQLVLGSTRASTTPSRSTSAPSSCSSAGRSFADRARGASAPRSPTFAAIARGGRRVVAGDHRDADAGAPARGDRVAPRSGRGGSSRPSRPSSSRSRSASSASRDRSPAVERRACRRPAPAGPARPSPRSAAAAASSATPAARQERVGRALDEHLAVHDDRHAPAARIEREPAPLRCARLVGVDVDPSRRASASSAASIGSPWRPTRRPRSTARPVEQRRREPASVPSRAHGLGGPSTRRRPGRSRARRCVAVPAGVQTSTTAISLRVSVPVLSVQMNVVEPSVSTASRRRTSACRRAMRCAPMASDSVTVGSSPSGTSATVTPIANRNPSRGGDADRAARCRRSRRRPDSAMIAIVRTTRSSSSASGLRGTLAAAGELGDPGQPGRCAGGGRPSRAPRPRPRTCPRTASSPLADRGGHALAGQHRRVDEQPRGPRAFAGRPRSGRRPRAARRRPTTSSLASIVDAAPRRGRR